MSAQVLSSPLATRLIADHGAVCLTVRLDGYEEDEVNDALEMTVTKFVLDDIAPMMNAQELDVESVVIRELIELAPQSEVVVWPFRLRLAKRESSC